MSDGGIGQGVSYWATINIRGDLTKDELQSVVKQIKEILDGETDDGKPVDGEVVHAARSSTHSPAELSVSVAKLTDRDR